MRYQIVAFSHKYCDQELREALAFTHDEAKKDMLSHLTDFAFIDEAFIISTCNRVEVVMATRDPFASYHSVLGLMAQHSGINFYTLKQAAKVYNDTEAVRHFFDVIASLDSLVVGESQITGQVKEAFRFAYEHATASRRLNHLVAQGVRCAAEVRNATNISQNPVSIASVAVAQAHQLLGDTIQGMRAVVVGAGEMGILAAKHLLRVGCDVVLIGRDKQKVDAIAASLGENIQGDSVDKLPAYLNRYRLLFSATSSKDPVITPAMIENDTLDRIWFDMAIPRDIADISHPKLQLFRIDDLRTISEQNHALREEQALKASEIVRRHLDDFAAWLQTLAIEPTIKTMRLSVHDAIETELARAIAKGFVPAAYEANMRKMAQQMFNRFLHQPTLAMRAAAKETDQSACLEAIQSWFHTPPKDEG